MTAEIPEVGRQAAQVLIDCVSVFDVDADEGVNAHAMNLALKRLNEIDALTVRVTSTGNTQVDASDLVGGTLTAVQWLVLELAAARGVSKDVIVAALRDYIG